MPADVPSDLAPIFVAGRQHSGNTMLAMALGRLPGVLGCVEEGNYFERREAIAAMPPDERVRAVVQRLRLNGAPISVDTEEALRTTLSGLARSGGSIDDLFAQGMTTILKAEGCERWVQKATSYVFQVDRILNTFPHASIVFLARNPLDIGASSKRRGHTRDLFRMAWGWRVGVQRAIDQQRRHPERFRIVRYEDLVQAPETAVRSVCDFVGLDYSGEAVNVAHVNRAEDKHVLTSERRGITASRVFYYEEALTRGEQAAIRRVVGGALDAVYPELQDARLTLGSELRGLTSSDRVRSG